MLNNYNYNDIVEFVTFAILWNYETVADIIQKISFLPKITEAFMAYY